MKLDEGFPARKLTAYCPGEDLQMGETMAANSDDLRPADGTDTQVTKAARQAEIESPQERQVRYLHILDQFGDGLPPDALLTIKVELAKSLMGED